MHPDQSRTGALFRHSAKVRYLCSCSGRGGERRKDRREGRGGEGRGEEREGKGGVEGRGEGGEGTGMRK